MQPGGAVRGIISENKAISGVRKSGNFKKILFRGARIEIFSGKRAVEVYNFHNETVGRVFLPKHTDRTENEWCEASSASAA